MEQVIISTRLPKNMVTEVRGCIKGVFLNEADFFRAAIRDALLKYKIAQIRTDYKKERNAVAAVRKLRKVTSSLSDAEYEKWISENAKEMP